MKNKLPKIKIYNDRNRYKLKWWADNEQYQLSFPDEITARLALAKINLAMSGAADWPADLLALPAVQKYLHKGKERADTQNVIEQYIRIISGEVTEGWVKFTQNCLEDLNDEYELHKVSISEAQEYISSIGRAQTVSTRNKKLLVIKKFYNWAMSAHYWPMNPFNEIKKLRAVKINTDIHYLTRSERTLVLEKAAERKYGLAVWIALFTGMRCGEVFSLKWDNINLNTETMVTQSKGGSARTVPIAEQLLQKLQKERNKTGYVFECWEKYRDASRWLIDWLRADLADVVDSDCIGWNSFRHTFCTLLVQNGVSLDKVAMWAGHSQKICKQHYARFIPKDQKDSDIDRL